MAGQNTNTGTGEKSQATQSFFIFVRDNNSGQIKSIVIPGDVQIGLDGNPSDLTLMGRFSVASKNYDVSLANKGILQTTPDDTIIGVSLVVTPISGRISLYLSQSPREGELHFIKDMTGTSSTVPIDVYPTTKYTIDGMNVVTLSDPTASLALVFLNGNWHRLVAGLGTSGGAGAPSNASFVTINPETSLTSERHLTGSLATPANILMTDHGAKATVSFDLSQILGVGAGTFTYATVTADAFGRVTAISAGATPPSANSSFLTAQNEPTLPNHRQMSGGLGTTVTDSGAGTFFEFNVDPRIVPFLTGATYSGPVIFNSGLTGSLQQLPFGKGAYIVGIGGINVTTGSNGQIIISGSSGGGGGSITSITGSGGTSVSNVGGAYTISSSVYADQQAAYLLAVPEALIDLPSARTLAAGSNITFTDGGPGGTFTIASTGGGGSSGSGGPVPSPSPAVAYMGHCTGSLNFGTHTAWTDLITTVPGNFFDDIQQGITRSGTTFTVNTTGYYQFHAFFNAIQSSQYIAFRLSGSNGTILQRTTWQNGGQPPMVMDGIVQLNSGSSFKLQFYDSGGSLWGSSDPIGTAPDQENMRTGDVSIFLINPLSVSITGVTGSFVPADQFDFLYWPCHDTTGPYVLNYGTAGAAGHMTASSAVVRFNQPGAIGTSVGPNTNGATSQYIWIVNTATQPVPNTTNISISAWFRPENSTAGTHQKVVHKAYFNSPSSWNSPFESMDIALNGSGDGRLEFAWSIGGVGNSLNPIASCSVSQEQWHHAGWTYDGAHVRTYLDGVHLDTLAVTGPLDFTQNGWWAIGGNPASLSENFQGQIEDVRVANTVRNDAWWAAVWLSGRPSATIAVNNTVISNVNGYNARYTQPDANTMHEWRCLDSGSTTLADSVDSAPMTVDNSQVPGTPILLDVTSLFDGAILLRGNANSCYTSDNISEPPSSSFSLDCWIQFDGVSSNEYFFGRQWKDPLDPSNFSAVSLATAGPGTLGYWMTLAGGAEAGGYSKWSFNTDGQWHHVGLTFDGNNVRLYLDGDNVFTEARVGNADFTFPAPWFLGQFKTTPGTNRSFNGKLCDARISNIVRPPWYFRDIYQLGIGWASGSTGILTGSGGSSSGSSGPDFDVFNPFGPSSAGTTSSISIDTQGRTPAQIGTDVYFFVSGTKGLPPGNIGRLVDVFGGDTVHSGSVLALDGGGFTGSLTQTAAGNAYIIGIGSVGVTTNSLGQVVVSGSGGGGGGGGTTINNIFTASSAVIGQGAYFGFVTSSVWWNQTASWTPFTQALPDATVTDVISQSIFRNGSAFQFVNAGVYAFHANFNAYGTDAYISLRLNGVSSSKGVALERSTYRTTPADQNQVQLDGLFTASIGDIWVLEYITSGTTFPWTGSNPLPGDGPMHTGEVSIFMLSPGSAGTVSSSLANFYVPPDLNTYAYWKLDEASSASTFVNSSPLGLTANLSNVNGHASTFPYQGGIYGNALQVTGSITYVSGAAGFVVTGSNPNQLSVSAWVYVYEYTTYGEIIFKKYTNDETWAAPFVTLNIALNNTNDGQMFFAITTAGQTQHNQTGGLIRRRVWSHVGMSYDGNNIYCYINGDRVLQTAVAGAVDWNSPTGGGSYYLGAAPNAGANFQQFSGSIDEVRVEAIARPDDYFKDVYETGKFKYYVSGSSPLISTITGLAIAPKAPIYTIPILAGTVGTNTSFSGSKQSLGMGFFNPQTVQGFGGVSRRYFFRAVLDEFTIETNMSAAIDLNDYNGIVSFPPTTIPGSIMSTSSGTSLQLQAELTSLFQFVTGSGLLEARLWRTVSGSLASIANCRNARFDVEFS